MPTIIASSMKEAKELVNARKYREIVLNFDVDADDFLPLQRLSVTLKSPLQTKIATHRLH